MITTTVHHDHFIATSSTEIIRISLSLKIQIKHLSKTLDLNGQCQRKMQIERVYLF